MSEAPFAHVGIVGLGVMGGSLARALKARWPEISIRGHSLAPAERQAAVGTAVIDRGCDRPEDAVEGADLVVIATPLGAALELLPALARASGDAVLTELTSLKTEIVRAAEAEGVGERFVASHPMAGSERSGWVASRADLYVDRTVWLVGESARPGIRAGIEALWTGVGGRPEWTDAPGHDRRMIWTSHLPQLLSTTLAGALADQGYGREELGPGGEGMTRLAGSPTDMWLELLSRNPQGEVRSLASIAARLEGLGEALGRGDLEELRRRIEDGRRWQLGDPDASPPGEEER